MKTKFYWFAVLASAALIAQAQAGGHHGGGGGNFAAAGPGPTRSGGGPSFHSMPTRAFGSGRMIYSGQRFSSIGARPPAFGQRYISSTGGAPSRAVQFRRENINRSERPVQFSNAGNRAIMNVRHDGNRAGQLRGGNNLPTNWRKHVV